MLYVDSLHLRDTALDRGLLESLAGAHLTDCTRLLELPLEFLQGALDILAFLNLYDNHSLYHLLFSKMDCKGRHFFGNPKFLANFTLL